MRTLGVVPAYVGVSLPYCPFLLACEVSCHKKFPKKMKSTMADHKFARRLVSYAATGIACANNVLHTAAHTGRCPGQRGGVFADTKYVGLFGPVSLHAFCRRTRVLVVLYRPCSMRAVAGWRGALVNRTCWYVFVGEIPFAAEDRDSYPRARLGPLK
jgi:hypothetical protein